MKYKGKKSESEKPDNGLQISSFLEKKRNG